MKKNNHAETKEFELIPIGKIEMKENSVYIHVFHDFKPALKYLELFSHAILSSADHQREYSGFGKIHVTTIQILNVDAKEGTIEIGSLMKVKEMVLDIKPYFPCEDRVREARICQPLSALEMNDVPYAIDENIYKIQQIGVTRKMEEEFYLELNSAHVDLIKQLEGVSHIRVLWWFDKFDKSIYRKTTMCNPPYENAPRTGIFASRSPVRPNPIAITTVRVISSDLLKGLIKISQIDAFDHSPIIGIIPYIPAYDKVEDYRVPEWLAHWPPWLDDRENNQAITGNAIKPSDISRIKTYMAPSSKEPQPHNNFFEEVPQTEPSPSDHICIIEAKQNNLKGISCKIPKNKFTVITGVSGSGKSSLAFDTIYAESQRRFMDSMSVTGKALFEQLEKPAFGQITGLPPAVAIEQKTAGRNPRSTVGTMTNIDDYLRLLFSKIGTRHCPECSKAMTPLNPDEIVNLLNSLLPETRLSIRPYGSQEAFEEELVCSDHETQNEFDKRLKKSVEKGLFKGHGAIEVKLNHQEVFLFQTKEMCFHCNRIFFNMTASTFSFNHPESMCPVCKGLGVKLEVDEGLIVSNPQLSILDGASAWWGNLRKHQQKPNANWMKGEILALAKELKVDLELPWQALPESFRQQALYGSEGREVSFIYENTNGRKGEIVRPVEGAYHTITRLFRENSGDTAARIGASFMRESRCSGCGGERLAAEGRLVEIHGTRFPETMAMTLEALKEWVICLPQSLTQDELKISGQLLKDLKMLLENLIHVGVSYLTLDRPVPSLSGGEAQRLRLATRLGSGITNILYVLDEPSIGLHPRDHGKLIGMMQRLRDEGNTVIAVEHDADTMLAADNIIDIGPGAGQHGGWVIAEGSPEEIMKNERSETGKYLKAYQNKKTGSQAPGKRANDWLEIMGARENNLKNIDVSIPLEVLTCITGVSGSGKSSLITKTLYPALAKLLNRADTVPGPYCSIEGAENLDQIINITQQPIGRTPRSNPATYTGVFDEIRNLFAALAQSRQKGYKQNKFSFNSKEGQCQACRGEGRKRVEMHFMPDVWVECRVCQGKRFNQEALEIKYHGVTIADVLAMNVEEALCFFKDSKKITRVLQTLYDVGLGYIQLGQSALILSGGEAQRIKLAKELSKERTGKTIFLLDEPTTGLHPTDVGNLLSMLQRMTKAGNTVLVIEHNLEVIRNADWVIDLGPEGGSGGGYVMAQGTPQDVAEIDESYTGQFLKNH